MSTPDKKYVPMSVQLKGPLYQIVESYYPKQFKFLIACHSHRVQKESGFSLTTFKCYNLIKRSLNSKQNQVLVQEILKEFKMHGIKEFSKEDLTESLCLSVFKEAKSKLYYLNENECNNIFSLYLKTTQPKIVLISSMAEVIAYDKFKEEIPNTKLMVCCSGSMSLSNLISTLEKSKDKIYYLKINSLSFDSLKEIENVKYLVLDYSQIEKVNLSTYSNLIRRAQYVKLITKKETSISGFLENVKHLSCDNPPQEILQDLESIEINQFSNNTVSQSDFPQLTHLILKNENITIALNHPLQKVTVMCNYKGIVPNCVNFYSESTNSSTINEKTEFPILKKLTISGFPYSNISIPNIDKLDVKLKSESDVTNVLTFLESHSQKIRVLYLFFEEAVKNSKHINQIFSLNYSRLEKLKIKGATISVANVRSLHNKCQLSKLKKINVEFSTSERFRELLAINLDLSGLEYLKIRNQIGNEEIIKGLCQMNLPKLKVLKVDIDCMDEEFMTQCLINSTFKNTLEVLKVAHSFKTYLNVLFYHLKHLRYVSYIHEKDEKERNNYYFGFEKIIIEISDPTTKYEEKKCIIF